MATAKTPSRKATAPATSKKAAAKPVKAAPAKSAPRPGPVRKKPASAVSPEQRSHYVEVAAYYIAERRGFAPGDVMQDWLAAEAEINRLIASGKLG